MTMMTNRIASLQQMLQLKHERKFRRTMSSVETLAEYKYIPEVKFFACCKLFLFPALVTIKLSFFYLRHDTCDCLQRIQKPSHAWLHDCRPTLRKLRAVHLLFVHPLFPEVTDKLKDRKWALTQSTKYIAYIQRFPV